MPATSPNHFHVLIDRSQSLFLSDLTSWYDVVVTLDDFKATLVQTSAPDVSPLLRALWHDARGDWDAAHRVAQDIDDKTGAWVHAYLHRKEGDPGNAAYWYRRAGQPVATDPLDAEWARIVAALLDQADDTARP